MNLSDIFKEALLEAKKKKPSAGLTKKQKSDVAKKAKAGEDIGKKGKGFEKLAKKAGGGEKGEKIAAAAMWKNTKRVKEGTVDEVGSGDLGGLVLVKAFQSGDDKVRELLNMELSIKGNSTFEKFKNELLNAGKPDVDSAVKSLLPHINKIKNLDLKDKQYIKDTAKYSKSLEEGEDHADHEIYMAKTSLKSIAKSVMDLMQKLEGGERDIPAWIQDHISNAENFIDQAAQGFHELGKNYKDEEDDNDSEESEMIQPVDEKKLTKDEKTKKDQILKAMEKEGGGKKKMGPKQYAIATAQAIKSAE
jgi:hypothetical protein